MSCRLAPLIPQFERRTWELLRCLERRQGEAKDGFVNLAEAMYHWAHDFMVRRLTWHVRDLVLMSTSRETWYLVDVISS